MRALIDTNVVLDVLLAREPHLADSQQVLSLVRHGRIEGALCATSITTIEYLVNRARGAAVAERAVRSLLDAFEVAPVDGEVLRRALDLGFGDYEYAVLYAAAVAIGADAIVTRDRTGFTRATLPVMSPGEAVAAVLGTGA